MAALVQSYPQSAGQMTMLQPRPTSASGMAPSQAQQGQSYASRAAHPHRNSFHGLPSGNGSQTGYRGSVGPVQQYTFTSTPSLNTGIQWQQYGQYRATSTSAVPNPQSFNANSNAGRSRYHASASMTNLPGSSAVGTSMGNSRDDLAIPSTTMQRVSPAPRPQSSSYLSSTPSHNSTAHAQGQHTPTRSIPDRYRRTAQRNADASAVSYAGQSQPSASNVATFYANGYNQRAQADERVHAQRNLQVAGPGRPNSFVGAVPRFVADDMLVGRGYSQADAKRLRRRSMPALNSADFAKPLTPPNHLAQPAQSSRPETLTPPKSADTDRPKPALLTVNNGIIDSTKPVHSRSGSSDSRTSSRSDNNSRPSSSANRNSNLSAPTGNPALLSSAGPDETSQSQEYSLVNIPPRGSSTDAATSKRAPAPSPLSRPVTMESNQDKGEAAAGAAAAEAVRSATQPGSPRQPPLQSPAVQQLSAINAKGGRLRSKTSRLRRAFSFGSAAEFRGAGGADAGETEINGHSRLHKDPSPEAMYDAEQARIAQQQEAAGMGNNIYAGGRIFTGSTDNISISSTASSASIMIRKMGRGMKKSGRSLVGLFRPKSVIGVPAADAAIPDAGQAEVSMINVEAERERVNVHADPHSQPGGGTGFPHLERNSIDTAKTPSLVPERLGSSGTDNSAPRKSIVGGEAERAEALAAVKKGILKRGSSSPSPKPSDAQNPGFDLPRQITESPQSSAPSTPRDDPEGHRRTNSIAIGNEDYFMTALRLRQDTKSAPGTPHGGLKRNATFSPRIIFHDTWPSGEYDRRGEIATCNRLTPMLAQQIKEELNTFKMEMEVHENSKIYTHFF